MRMRAQGARWRAQIKGSNDKQIEKMALPWRVEICSKYFISCSQRNAGESPAGAFRHHFYGGDVRRGSHARERSQLLQALP